MKLVYSPYWPGNVNPHFPYGCSRTRNAAIQRADAPLIQPSMRWVSEKERQRIKKAKSEWKHSELN